MSGRERERLAPTSGGIYGGGDVVPTRPLIALRPSQAQTVFDIRGRVDGEPEQFRPPSRAVSRGASVALAHRRPYTGSAEERGRRPLLWIPVPDEPPLELVRLYLVLHIPQQPVVRLGSEFFAEHQARVDRLLDLRPQELVGMFRPVDWALRLKPEAEVEAMGKELREFYTHQNEMIARFMEIDELLDLGLPLNMIRNYGSDVLWGELEAVGNGAGPPHDVGSTRQHDLGTTSPHTPTAPYKVSQERLRVGVPGNIDLEGGQLLGYDKEAEEAQAAVAIYVNFAVNFVLLLGKVVVALATLLILMVALLVDLALDFLLTLIIFGLTWLARQLDLEVRRAYPVGRLRLEPLGVLVFLIIIIILFCEVGKEAFGRLFFGLDHEVVAVGRVALAIMLTTIAVKTGCWWWCRLMRLLAVQALAQDAMTDMVFNLFLILMPVLGVWWRCWWMDAAGALALCVYVIHLWLQTAFEHINNLTGAAALVDDQQVILYLCMRFAASIQKITAVNAYHAGDLLNVEVDLVVDPDTPLKDAHDIGEALQYAIETLPMVERAFVHLDYRAGNYLGHIG